MGITPGVEPGPVEDQPLLAEEPLPPGRSELAEKVEAIDERIRKAGPDEVQEADEAADAVEGDADDAHSRGADSDAGSDADSDEDPTSDEGVDAEDPEAQQG